ncbi:hypothetical protein SAMN05660461_5979 [Chitinophaga ginsengisegetis]|uniref:Uncharacterized protein n=1 Tax=Chitinophaga ginsengisegetis TaxID=393003 RepID=A0A1T5PCS8_9BACT|nr:hypothetical protein SAMN05660461_5979 [Chitinophaga ginsengisegetis]
MNCYKLLQRATIANVVCFWAYLSGCLTGFMPHKARKARGKSRIIGVGAIVFRFFKLIISTVTTVTIKKIKYIKANAVKDFTDVTVIDKLISTVTNCYKLLQSNAIKGFKKKSTTVAYCNSCNNR